MWDMVHLTVRIFITACLWTLALDLFGTPYADPWGGLVVSLVGIVNLVHLICTWSEKRPKR